MIKIEVRESGHKSGDLSIEKKRHHWQLLEGGGGALPGHFFDCLKYLIEIKEFYRVSIGLQTIQTEIANLVVWMWFGWADAMIQFQKRYLNQRIQPAYIWRIYSNYDRPSFFQSLGQRPQSQSHDFIKKYSKIDVKEWYSQH